MNWRAILGLFLICKTLVGTAIAADNLVYNGNFETGEDVLPAGWILWGEERFKDRANYTRDTADPFEGKASLRIHHPAGTNGSIVTSPSDHPIKSAANTSCVITFHARADAPGEGEFSIRSMKSTDPWTDAPAVGIFKLKLTNQWQPYRFTIRDGLDFKADDSRIFYLMFLAAANQADARTMWVDDIRMSAEPNPGDLSGIKHMETIDYAQVNHVLTPGEKLNVTIDVAKSVRLASNMAAGISFHKVRGHPAFPYDQYGKYVAMPEHEKAIASLKLPWTRFYDVTDPRATVECSLDQIAAMCWKFGIPEERVVLELDEEHAKRATSPERWAAAVKYSMGKGYKFHNWEIGNEVYAAHINSPGEAAFEEPEQYVQHFLAATTAIKAVQSTARFGISVHAQMHGWHEYTLLRTAGSYDFVVPHLYAGDSAFTTPFEQVVLNQNYRTLDLAARLNAMIAAYNPGRKVEILDTEWGLHSMGPQGESADSTGRNTNVIGSLHRAVRMIYYIREGMVAGASTWGIIGRTSEPGFATLLADAPEKRTLMYWLYYHLNRSIADNVLMISGTAPYVETDKPTERGPLTPILATATTDLRTVQIIAVNGSWSSTVPAMFMLTSGSVGDVTAFALTQDSLDASPIYPDAKDPGVAVPTKVNDRTITFDLPARSIVFMTVRMK